MKRFKPTHACAAIGLLLVTACGKPHETSSGTPSQIDDSANIAAQSSIAIDGDDEFSHLVVQLPAEYDDVRLCIGAVTTCQTPDATLIGLTKTSPGFWRSEAPIDIRQDFSAHVVRRDGDRNRILYSSDHEGLSPTDGDTPSSSAPSAVVLPPPNELPKMRPVPNTQVAYDYHGTLSRSHPSAAVIRMVVQSGTLKNAKQVYVTGTLVNLSNSKIKLPLSRVVPVSNGNTLDFTVDQLSPNTVYRLEGVKITNASTGITTPPPSVTMRHPFHVATAEENKLSQARRRLVLRALAESYDWDHGNYQSSKGYASGSWCDRFYTWAVAKDFKLAYQYSAKTFFSQYRTLGNASRIPTLAKTKSVMGDLIRYEGTNLGTHTLMIVAYDHALKSIWTVEGNYNSRVMRLKRGVSSGWMHGHLIDAQVK